MILIVAAKDIGDTIVKGDLIHYLENEGEYGRKEGFSNAILNGAFSDEEDHRLHSPFVYLDLPLVTRDDCDEIRDSLNYDDVNGELVATARTYKIEFESLEKRSAGSTYGEGEASPTKDKYAAIVGGGVRRDTLNAYLEILRDDVSIEDIRVVR